MEKAKKLYAILWVDDWTSFPLSKRDIRWFHKNAGPLSLGLEMDARIPRPFKRQIRLLAEDSDNSDYPSHHYHCVRWVGLRLIKRMYDCLRLRSYIYALARALRMERWGQRIRMTLQYGAKAQGLWLSLVVAVLLFLGLSILLFTVQPIALAVFIGLGVSVFGPVGLFLAAQRGSNWEPVFSDWDYNRAFLQELKRSLQEEGLRYPVVLRHGWSLPPASSMQFYLCEMGALADASGTPTPEDEVAKKGTRRLRWTNTQPYYASLSRDYDVAWDGLNEADRGILELPVNLGNIAEHGFNGFSRERIEQFPEGSLVSAYMHGWDDFSEIRDWVVYLRSRYDVTFLRADQYVKIFMKRHPRPVLIQRSFKASWVAKVGNRPHAIHEVDSETVSVEVDGMDHGAIELVLHVNTELPVPEIYIDFPEVTVLDHLRTEENEGMTVIKNVENGIYHVRIWSPVVDKRNHETSLRR